MFHSLKECVILSAFPPLGDASQTNKRKVKKQMKITGLKVLQDKGWKPDSTFTSDDGRTMPILANHKVVCQDERNDIVNVSIVTPSPLSLRVGSPLGDVFLVGNVAHSQFGWSLKGEIAKS